MVVQGEPHSLRAAVLVGSTVVGPASLAGIEYDPALPAAAPSPVPSACSPVAVEVVAWEHTCYHTKGVKLKWCCL